VVALASFAETASAAPPTAGAVLEVTGVARVVSQPSAHAVNLSQISA
jgi:hypothetical protein